MLLQVSFFPFFLNYFQSDIHAHLFIETEPINGITNYGDKSNCNPWSSSHWIYQECLTHTTLIFQESVHSALIFALQ